MKKRPLSVLRQHLGEISLTCGIPHREATLKVAAEAKGKTDCCAEHVQDGVWETLGAVYICVLLVDKPIPLLLLSYQD